MKKVIRKKPLKKSSEKAVKKKVATKKVTKKVAKKETSKSSVKPKSKEETPKIERKKMIRSKDGLSLTQKTIQLLRGADKTDEMISKELIKQFPDAKYNDPGIVKYHRAKHNRNNPEDKLVEMIKVKQGRKTLIVQKGSHTPEEEPKKVVAKKEKTEKKSTKKVAKKSVKKKVSRKKK